MSSLTLPSGAADTRAMRRCTTLGRLRIAGLLAVALGLGSMLLSPWGGATAASTGALAPACVGIGLLLIVAPAWGPLRRRAGSLAVGAGLAFAALIGVMGTSDLPLAVGAGCVLLPAFAALLALGWPVQLGLGAATTALLTGVTLAGESPRGAMLVAAALSLATAASMSIAGLLDARRSRLLARVARLRRLRRRRPRAQARPGSGDERIASLSHDLRNPLAVALGYADMAADEDLPLEERARSLSRVKRSLWELTQMVENVLDSSAEEAGALVLTPEVVEVGTLCADLCDAVEVLARGKPLRIRVHGAPGLRVLADRQRLARVLGNLLGNAVKYTAQGEIVLRAERDGDRVLFEVSDTGPGIAADELPTIFEAYRQGNGAARGGVGLGLAISRILTERMGGSLHVESTPGAGSCFSVSLPAAAEPHRRSAAAA